MGGHKWRQADSGEVRELCANSTQETRELQMVQSCSAGGFPAPGWPARAAQVGQRSCKIPPKWWSLINVTQVHNVDHQKCHKFRGVCEKGCITSGLRDEVQGDVGPRPSRYGEHGGDRQVAGERPLLRAQVNSGVCPQGQPPEMSPLQSDGTFPVQWVGAHSSSCKHRDWGVNKRMTRFTWRRSRINP